MKKLSYCLCGDKRAEERWEKVKEQELSLSGLWLWAKAAMLHGKKGDIRVIQRQHELEKYDVVAINLTPGNFALPQVIHDELGKSSSTKLIVNIDFEVDNWDTIWQYPTLMKKVLDGADLIFHVEPVGASVLEHVLGRKVPVLPHPVDLKGLDKIKREKRDPTIVTLYHRHTREIAMPYWAQKDVPLNRVLLGYHGGKVPASQMYDLALGYMEFSDAMEVLSKALIGYHVHSGYTGGRGVIECAALLVPCICSETIYASKMCFPSLTCKPFDIKRQHELMMKLIVDREYTDRVIRYAWEAAEHFSLENCYNRMCEALEEEERPSKLKSGFFWDDEYRTKIKYQVEQPHEDYTKCWDIFLDDIKHKNIIDIGCGPGIFAQYLNNSGYTGNYVGYDFSQKAIKIAKDRNLPEEFRFECNEITPDSIRDITKGDHRKNTVVTAISLLQHLEDDKTILNAINTKLHIIATIIRNIGVSHVRYFQTEDEAKGYYGDFFNSYSLCGKHVLAIRRGVNSERR